MSDSRAAPKNSLETLKRLRELREATQRVYDMMPPLGIPLPMDTAAIQKVVFDALDLHAANLRFLRHCRLDYGGDYGNDPPQGTDFVLRVIEQWARLAPAEKAKHWMSFAFYPEPTNEAGQAGYSWGGQLDDWIGQCAGEGADLVAAIAKARARAPRAGKERGLVFICYCHKDEKWLGRLRQMLAPVIKGNVLPVWHDQKIKPGKEWRREIARALSKTKVGVLLLTENFFASKFINDVELKYLWKNAKAYRIRLLPVSVGYCMWEKSPLARLQFANNPSKPLAQCRGANRDRLLKEVCEKIQAAYNEHSRPRRGKGL
jgi:hypothetical protein